MKKNYITPKINLSKANIEFSICNASIGIETGDGNSENTPGDKIDDTDKPFVIGSKNRFYGDSDDGWE